MSSVRSPSAAPLDFAPWLAAIGRHRSVTVIPPSACIKDKRGWNNHVAQQLQLLAAIADRSVNSIFVRNIDTDCDIDQRIDTPPRSGSQALFVFLDESQNFARMRARAGADAACRASDRLVVCSDLPGEAAALEILALSGKR